MRHSCWRGTANQIITKIIMDNPRMAEGPLRKLISEAYPWGERAHHPYKIWCSAVHECLWGLRRIGRKPNKQDMEDVNLFSQGGVVLMQMFKSHINETYGYGEVKEDRI